ncbi:MAG: hypothetical protein GXP29_01685 [Planctomycetes bacterium]|nr:hypothetical protein [Planctomycetota bacterium]
MLTTRDIVKADLRTTGATNDAIIDRVIDEVSVWIAGELHRYDTVRGVSLLERQVGRIAFPQALCGGEKVRLGAYPIESIAEVKQTWDRDFDASLALVEGTDFLVDTSRGGDALVHLRSGFYGDDGPASVGIIRVTYTGGYWSDIDNAPPAGATALPSVLTHAATRLVVHLFKHRDKFGERQISVGDMAVSGVTDDMLKIVRNMIAPYRNWS